MRHLQITKRRIPLGRADEYATLWHALRQAAAQRDARAWLFRAQAGDHFVEFVEWQSDRAHSVFDQAAVSASFAALNAAFPFEESDTWLEARI